MLKCLIFSGLAADVCDRWSCGLLSLGGCVVVLAFLSKWGRVGLRMDGYLVGLMEFSTDSLRSGDSSF